MPIERRRRPLAGEKDPGRTSKPDRHRSDRLEPDSAGAIGHDPDGEAHRLGAHVLPRISRVDTEPEGDAPRSNRGRGPRNYQRPDERIREDVCDLLTVDEEVDATDIEVTVASGVVTLGGSVDERRIKWLAEEIATRCLGVKEVQNRLRVTRAAARSPSRSGADQQAASGTKRKVRGEFCAPERRRGRR